ncbi:carbohydrate ABC transporter permease [Jiangella asiatica]|uniref:carbohydrate ABC transporter permease n=1 Tax=Jiangella asiatica TaxID=2530372 RepID=UPI0013A5D289|nr:sugar ABC transporter permease [Jiangella asiatica]
MFFTAFTLIYTVGASFTNWDLSRPQTSFIGWDNYRRALADERVRDSLIKSGFFVTGVVVLSVLFGFLIAVLLNNRFRGRTLIRVIVVVPWVLSEIATGVVARILLNGNGVIASALEQLGIDFDPLSSKSGAMVTLILVETWRSIGLVTVIALAGLQAIPPVIYEAARMDGARSVRTIWNITLPLVRPTLLIAAILLAISNFNLVTIIFAVTDGGPLEATQTSAFYMYKQSFEYYALGYGSTIAVIMSVINVVAIVCFVLAQRERGVRR